MPRELDREGAVLRVPWTQPGTLRAMVQVLPSARPCAPSANSFEKVGAAAPAEGRSRGIERPPRDDLYVPWARVGCEVVHSATGFPGCRKLRWRPEVKGTQHAAPEGVCCPAWAGLLAMEAAAAHGTLRLPLKPAASGPQPPAARAHLDRRLGRPRLLRSRPPPLKLPGTDSHGPMDPPKTSLTGERLPSG